MRRNKVIVYSFNPFAQQIAKTLRENLDDKLITYFNHFTIIKI